MFYRIGERDYHQVHVELTFGDDVLRGGPVVQRYFPQWSHDAVTWHTYANLGMCREGFETPESAERFLDKKNPRFREHFKGIVTLEKDPKEALPQIDVRFRHAHPPA